MEILELRTQIHERVEKAEPEVLAILMEVLEGATAKDPRYSAEDIAEFDRRTAAYKSGDDKGRTIDEFWDSIKSRTGQ